MGRKRGVGIKENLKDLHVAETRSMIKLFMVCILYAIGLLIECGVMFDLQSS